MAVPSSNLGDFLLTHWAKSVLLFPKMKQPVFSLERCLHANVQTLFKVGFPCWIIGVCLCFDFGVSLDGHVLSLCQVDLLAVDFSVEDPIVSSTGLEVFLRDPLVRLLWVSPSHPLPQPSIDRVVYRTKHICADDVLMILSPSDNDGVEHQDQPSRRECLVLLNDFPDLLQVGVHILLRWF